MSKFELHKYSGMAYESNQIIAFSENASLVVSDIDEKMKTHIGVSAVQVSNLTQQEFDYFITNYGDTFESIYFFHNDTSLADIFCVYSSPRSCLWIVRASLFVMPS